jgi:hypothetical protein
MRWHRKPKLRMKTSRFSSFGCSFKFRESQQHRSSAPLAHFYRHTT